MALEMNAEIRAQWCAALRSNEYRQTTGRLRREVDGEVRYCCLGVLTDLAIKAGVEGASWDHDILPPAVAAWAGMPAGRDGRPGSNPVVHGYRAAAELNDGGWTFTRLADAIDGGEAA